MEVCGRVAADTLEGMRSAHPPVGAVLPTEGCSGSRSCRGRGDLHSENNGRPSNDFLDFNDFNDKNGVLHGAGSTWPLAEDTRRCSPDPAGIFRRERCRSPVNCRTKHQLCPAETTALVDTSRAACLDSPWHTKKRH